MRILLPVLALIAALAAAAAEEPQTYAVLIAGEGGEANFVEDYRDWTARFHALLTARYGVPADHVAVLVERPELLPNLSAVISTREHVLAAVAAAVAKAKPGDQLVVALIGHGTGQGGVSKLCLPGPDLSDADLAAALAPCATREVVVIAASAAGHGFLEACSLPGRVMISATSGASEGNECYLMEFFLRACEGAGALGIDLLTAFDQAATECPKWYLRQYIDASDKHHPKWTVQGKQSRELWQKLYANAPGKVLVPGDKPDEPDGEPVLGAWGPQWNNRRKPPEHAQLDDNGDRAGTGVFIDNQFAPLAGDDEAADGWVASRTRLGKPRGDTRPPPPPLAKVAEP